MRAFIVEPASAPKRNLWASTLCPSDDSAAPIPERFDSKAIRRQLQAIREYTAAHLNSLAREFKDNVSAGSIQAGARVGRGGAWGEVDGGVASVTWAADANAAVRAICELTDASQPVAISNSCVVQELSPGLVAKGFRLIDSYQAQFEDKEFENKIVQHWQFPLVDGGMSWESFDSTEIPSKPDDTRGTSRDLVALLGVNAAAAEDGSLYFLQHTKNIGSLLREARKLIVIVGLDKIVKDRSAAFFQSKCVGLFGMESILLDLRRDASARAGETRRAVAQDSGVPQERHVILLDNGRTRIGKGPYRELLKCIGCRACGKQCPGYRNLEAFEHYPKEFLWSFLQGRNPSIELCSYCDMCKYECPVGIDLPWLMAQAKAEYSPQIARTPAARLMTNLSQLARMTDFAPPVVNRLIELGAVRLLLEWIGGVDRRRRLPVFRNHTFRQWFEAHGEAVGRT